MRAIHDILADDGVWVFEQSYLPTMLSQMAYDTVCHEHLSYYALKQIKWMTDRCGFKIIDLEINNTNGGSFCVLQAKIGSRHRECTARIDELLAAEEAAGLDTLRPFIEFRDAVVTQCDEFSQFVRSETAVGAIGPRVTASTKGNVLLQYCNFTAQDIQAIAEVNEEKIRMLYAADADSDPVGSRGAQAAARITCSFCPGTLRDGIVRREAAYYEKRKAGVSAPSCSATVAAAGSHTQCRGLVVPHELTV